MLEISSKIVSTYDIDGKEIKVFVLFIKRGEAVYNCAMEINDWINDRERVFNVLSPMLFQLCEGAYHKESEGK